MIRRLSVAMVAVALVGCSKGSAANNTSAAPSASGGSRASATPATPGTPSPKYSFPPYHPKVKPADFSTNVTNAYMPFKPGSTAVYLGTRDGAPLRIEVSVTKETKTIMGVRCIVVRDIVSGALEERTTDWYAQDSKGNLWYFGEDTKELKNGAVTSTAGSWTAGVNGALPGIVMYAHPKPGPPYREEYRPGEAEDVAQVVQIGASVNVPAGNYKNVVVTKNTDLLNTAKLEHKYYASGVGMVYLNGTVNGHVEIVRLTQLLTAK